MSDDPNARDIIPLLTWIGDVRYSRFLLQMLLALAAAFFKIRESFQETLEIDLLKHGALLDPETETVLQGR